MRRHENEELRPRLRASNRTALSATEDEHGMAFLEHDRHAGEIVDFFLREFECPYDDVRTRGFKLVVYTKADSVNINPEELSLDFGRHGEATEDPYRLELYNVLGDSMVGTHYEPVFHCAELVNRRSAAVRGKEQDASHEEVNRTTDIPVLGDIPDFLARPRKNA